MKPLWKQHWRRIEALSLRERLMIVVSVVFVMGAIADTLVLAPAKAQQSALRAEAATQVRELDALRQKLNSAARDAGADGPRDSLQQRLARSIDETKNVDRQIGERLGDAGRPARLPELVDQVLRRNDRLTLTRLITVAERPGEKSAAKGKEAPTAASLQWQAVDLGVSGSYLDLVQYLADLERALPELRWGPLKIHAEQTPPELSVRLFLAGEVK